MLKNLSGLLVCLSLSGCSSSIYIYVFNNTENVIRAYGVDENVLISPGEVKHTEVINGFKLCMNEKLYEYAFQDNAPPGKFYGTKHFPKHSVHFQVEDKGVLVLGMPSANYPIEATSQPPGYPVLPNEIGTCRI